jgi:hypothetical protein
MFDFPNAPTNGQLVQGGAGQFYAWDGAKWVGQMPPGPLPIASGGTGVTTAAAAPWVELVGDTMSGQLILQATNPTDNNAATRKLYVDNAVSNALAIANMKVALAGDTMTGPLVINQNAAALPAANFGGLQVAGADGQPQLIYLTSFGGAGAPNAQYRTRTARGTPAARTAMQSGDAIGAYSVEAAASATAWGTPAAISFFTREAWTATANGSYMAVATVPAGSTTGEYPAMFGRGLIVGGSIANDPGPGNISMAGGTIRFMGGAYPLQNADNANFAWQLGSGNGGFYWYSNSGFAVMQILSSGPLIVPPGVSTGNTSSGAGTVGLSPGSTSNIGYVNWYKPNGTRFAYMGYSQTELTLVLEGGGGVNFSITGGHVYPNPQATYWCGLAAGSGPWWYGVAAVTFPVQSDARHKTDITTLPADCLDLVEAIAPKRYQYINTPEGEEGRVFWGYIAQEVGEVFDAAGHDFSGAHRVHDGWHSLDYGQMNAVLWKAVQELTARVKSLEAQTQ